MSRLRTHLAPKLDDGRVEDGPPLCCPGATLHRVSGFALDQGWPLKSADLWGCHEHRSLFRPRQAGDPVGPVARAGASPPAAFARPSVEGPAGREGRAVAR